MNEPLFFPMPRKPPAPLPRGIRATFRRAVRAVAHDAIARWLDALGDAELERLAQAAARGPFHVEPRPERPVPRAPFRVLPGGSRR